MRELLTNRPGIQHHHDPTLCAGSYTYDAEGRRTALADQDTNIAPPILFLPGIRPNELFGAVDGTMNGIEKIYVHDAQGSVRAVVDDGGNIIGSAAAYSAYGSGGTDQHEAGFASGLGAGDLVQFHNRFYDPLSGQFTTEDPIGFAGGGNLYSYAHNNPVNFSDPFGLCPPEDNNRDDCPEGDGAEMTDGTDESRYQNLANWGAERGGVIGSVALNLGAALKAGAAIGDAIMGAKCDDGVCYGSPPAVTTRGAFTRDGFLNRNRYLRIGIGRHGGRQLFRISGKGIEKIKESGHINLPWIGPWGR